MAYSDISLCSSALLKIGARPIEVFDEGSAEADVAGKLYANTRDALLVAHPWAFSLRQAELIEAPIPPEADFEHAFHLPDDMLRTISAGSAGRGRGIAYRILGRNLVTDVSRVTLTYQFRADENDFPPHFAQALIARLAAEFCIPLTEGTSRTEALYRLATAELRVARLIDSQQATPLAVEDFTLIEARGI